MQKYQNIRMSNYLCDNLPNIRILFFMLTIDIDHNFNFLFESKLFRNSTASFVTIQWSITKYYFCSRYVACEMQSCLFKNYLASGLLKPCAIVLSMLRNKKVLATSIIYELKRLSYIKATIIHL